MDEEKLLRTKIAIDRKRRTKVNGLISGVSI